SFNFVPALRHRCFSLGYVCRYLSWGARRLNRRRCHFREHIFRFIGDRMRLLRGLAAIAAALTLRLSRVTLRTMLVHRLVMDNHAASSTDLTGFAEGLQQPKTELLSSHLHEPERRDFSDLMFRPVSAQALHHTAQHQITIGFEDHVDKVDDDDP